MDIGKHRLVPKHAKVSEKEKKELIEKYAINLRDLPRILIKDPALEKLSAKEGDVIKVVRESPTAKESIFFRRVVAK